MPSEELKERLSYVYGEGALVELEDEHRIGNKKRLEQLDELLDGILDDARNVASELAAKMVTKEMLELAASFEDGSGVNFTGDKLQLFVLPNANYADDESVTIDLYEAITNGAEHLDNRDAWLEHVADKLEALAKRVRDASDPQKAAEQNEAEKKYFEGRQ
jgi:hypothetical protein